jgi:hypothetical protein
LRGDVAGFGARCIERGSTVNCVEEIAEGLSVDLFLIHKLGGSRETGFAKGSVKERRKDAGGLGS